MKFTIDGRTAYAYTGGKPFDAALPCVVFLHGEPTHAMGKRERAELQKKQTAAQQANVELQATLAEREEAWRRIASPRRKAASVELRADDKADAADERVMSILEREHTVIPHPRRTAPHDDVAVDDRDALGGIAAVHSASVGGVPPAPAAERMSKRSCSEPSPMVESLPHTATGGAASVLRSMDSSLVCGCGCCGCGCCCTGVGFGCCTGTGVGSALPLGAAVTSGVGVAAGCATTPDPRRPSQPARCACPRAHTRRTGKSSRAMSGGTPAICATYAIGWLSRRSMSSIRANPRFVMRSWRTVSSSCCRSNVLVIAALV